MLSHDFISSSKENIVNALNYYPSKTLVGEEMKIAVIRDGLLLSIITLFNDVEIYDGVGKPPIYKLNYYGASIIPPTSCFILYKKIKKLSFF